MYAMTTAVQHGHENQTPATCVLPHRGRAL